VHDNTARRLGRDYPALSGGGRIFEAKTGQLAHGYWRQLAAAYLEAGVDHHLALLRRHAGGGDRRDHRADIARPPRALGADVIGLKTEALLLDMPVVGENVRLILPANTFEAGMALVFALDARTVRLQPLKTIETGADFLVQSFS
jgi:hypothetical protein